uniref:Chromosome 18 open reading frame 21 n=1 Tax=Canis lupus dingo TaxID=286419 RepID=A0A8C0KGY7_CANLU
MRQKHYLEAAARQLHDSCPGQARYLLTFEGTCPYCFQFLVLDNSRVRLKPKSRLTPKIQKLLNREARNCTLSFKEAKILKKYRDSKGVLDTYIWTINTHLRLKEYEQKKETPFSTKNVT